MFGRKGGFIYRQIKYMGASCDWDREAFTMSDRCCTAVREAFIRMHEDGVITRKKKLINWSCHLNSAISEIEVRVRARGYERERECVCVHVDAGCGTVAQTFPMPL